MLALVLDLVGLLVQVDTQVVELFLGEGCGWLFRVPIGLLCSEPVGNPCGALLVGPATSLTRRTVVVAQGSRLGIQDAVLGGLLGGRQGKLAVLGSSMAALVLEEIYPRAERR